MNSRKQEYNSQQSYTCAVIERLNVLIFGSYSTLKLALIHGIKKKI